MKKYILLLALVALLVGCGAPVPPEGDMWTPPALAQDDGELPEGREVVQRMVDFMQGNQELAVEALVTYETVQESGQKLQFEMLQRVAVRKPNQLHWVTLRDDGTVDQAWFDKGRFKMIRQPANVWVEILLPEDITGAVQQLVNTYMVVVPFPDLLSGDPDEPRLGDEHSIWYVGEALVNGQWTDHVAISKPGTYSQVWIHKGDPFPAKLAIAFTEDEGKPGYTARFSKWSNTIPADPSLFEFTAPPGAERIEVVPVIDQSTSLEGGSK